jgi:hypothetical protein
MIYFILGQFAFTKFLVPSAPISHKTLFTFKLHKFIFYNNYIFAFVNNLHPTLPILFLAKTNKQNT